MATLRAPAAEIYRVVAALPRHDHLTPRRELPTDGVYLFFERGETVSLDGATVDRIVRVGTHNRDGNFRQRIRQHYGHVSSFGGNKNGSVFRLHLGGALLRRRDHRDPRLPGWEKHMGPSYPDVEEEVSRVLRETFTFVCFAVPDAADRLSLESGLIALLAQHPLGSPSSGWLGHYAAAERIRRSGLWNTSQVDAMSLTPVQLGRIAGLIEETR